MDITFATDALQKQANDPKLCRKKMGAERAKRFKMRLDALAAALSLDDVRHMPGRFHELKGDRKGQWACDLVHPYRLIFEPQGRPIPVRENGSYDWNRIFAVRILEIVDYH